MPIFSETNIEVKVPENVPDYLVATVKAHDPDTVQEITYTLRQGPGDLFKVDAKTGQVKTIRGLDYEKEQNHELIIGTLENKGMAFGDFVKVIISVEDRNDIPPVFVSVPEPVTVNDDQPIGTIIGSMPAIDGDGTSPGNIVRYEIVGRGKALKYFQVDPDTGIIRIRDELRKEDDTEYQVDIRAYDLGEPQLSSVATLPVFIRHVLTDPNAESIEGKMVNDVIINPEAVGLAFSDVSYTVGVSESQAVNSTIKILQIINSKRSTKSTTRFKCDITQGNDLGHFALSMEDHACKIILIKPLDYENKTSHDIEISLNSNKYFVNPKQKTTKVKIIVQDENDNAPEFIFKSGPLEHDKNGTYYAVVSSDADIDTLVLQVKAEDKDMGKFGMIKYRIFDEESNMVSKDDSVSNLIEVD